MAPVAFKLTVESSIFTLGTDGIYRASSPSTGGGLGSVGISHAGGTGTVSMRFRSKPAWASAATIGAMDGEWALAATFPEILGMKGRYVIAATDSATPTPNEAEVTLEVETTLADGMELLRGRNHAPIRIVEADWPVLLDRNFEASNRRDPALYCKIRRHADGRLIVEVDYDATTRDVVVVPANWSREQLCGELGWFHSRCGAQLYNVIWWMARNLPPRAVD